MINKGKITIFLFGEGAGKEAEASGLTKLYFISIPISFSFLGWGKGGDEPPVEVKLTYLYTV